MFILDCSGEASNLLGVFVIIRTVLKIVQWVVPVVLILLGTIDLVKAVSAGKEEDIKKNQGVLIKRAIAAVVVFLIPIIVSMVMGLIGTDKTWKGCWDEAKDKSIGEYVGQDAIKAD